ncbi:MAG: hypothetical protein M1834_003119 [Cirrosporium novae-zelandiae]|nr:MAG: hypothetical protein M1834_003119 [Cirrosporium novae-zelandiae]
MKSLTFMACVAACAIVHAKSAEKRSDSWIASFWSDKYSCDGDNQKFTGNGVRACSAISGVYCVDGSTDEYSGLTIRAYGSSDCTGDYTTSDSYVLYENGDDQEFNSWEVCSC